MDVIVVEILVHAERVELFGSWHHLVGLLVIAPVADVANAFSGEQMRRVLSLLEVRAGPANGALARRLLHRLDRGADVPAFLVLRHADVDDLTTREALRDEFSITFLALSDQKRIVIGNGLIESQCRRDAVLVQYGEDAENPHPVAILVVA